MIENNQNNTNVEMLDVGVQPLENSNVINNNELPKNKKKNLFIVLIIISVLVLILIGLGVHYILTINNPKAIFTNINNYFYENLGKAITNSEQYIEQSYLYEGNVKINTNIEEYSFLNNETFNYSFGIDIQNEKAEAGIELIEGSSPLISANANIKDNNVYVDLDELFDKVILVDDKTIKDNLGISVNELFTELKNAYSEENITSLNYIVSRLQEISNKSLEKVNYEKTKEKIDINGKEIKVTKMSLTFNKENAQIIGNTIADEMLNDTKLLEKIASLAKTNKTDLVEMLNSFKEEINTIEEYDETLKMSIYTTGFLGDVVKVSFEENNIEEIYFINYENYKLLVLEDTSIEVKGKNLIVKYLGEVIITGTVNKLELDNIDIDFKSNDNTFKGKITCVNNSSNADLKIDLEINSDEKIEFNMSSNMNKVSDTQFDAKMIVKVAIDNQSVEVTNTSKLNLSSNIANINTNNALNYNNITEEDINKIEENLYKAFKGTEFEGLIAFDNEANFAENANYAIEAASHAMTLILIDSYSSEYTIENDTTYCFTLENLDGLLDIDGDYKDYEGTITVTKNGNNYNYRIEMHNSEYYVKKYNNVTEADVYSVENISVPLKTKCNNTAS